MLVTEPLKLRASGKVIFFKQQNKTNKQTNKTNPKNLGLMGHKNQMTEGILTMHIYINAYIYKTFKMYLVLDPEIPVIGMYPEK